jgi:histone H3/H4
MKRVLEDLGVRIAKEALDFAVHAHRKTVKDVDIRIAATKIVR